MAAPPPSTSASSTTARKGGSWCSYTCWGPGDGGGHLPHPGELHQPRGRDGPDCSQGVASGAPTDRDGVNGKCDKNASLG
jgi:hypothetical protein